MAELVMEDTRAAPLSLAAPACDYTIMHHTHFWEEFIDRGGRPRGRVVNISRRISDLVGQSSLCATLSECASRNVRVVV